ncbi:hypothetical protein CSA37_13290 [Candidatus Fermentibacteria bacterium]|nr:MAG: hypothetical protein CSA37_13290 [Candidatus Fermentibacteria bacterium]
MTLSLLLSALTMFSGFYPEFQTPSRGIGSETTGGGVRAFSMGGVSAGIPDSNMVSLANPAAAAFTPNTGFAWGSKFRDTPDPDWTDASVFPEVSVIMPLPLGLQFSALLSDRSRLVVEDQIQFENGSGEINWFGSTAESYLGLTVKASESLAFSAGGRCFFGSAHGDAVVLIDTPGPYLPITSQYRDDISLFPSWGITAGAFFTKGIISGGASITTDRDGSMDLHRDYIGSREADTTYRYSVPGEFNAGISARIHPQVLIGVDYFARKALKLLGSPTEAGSWTAAGAEYLPGSGFRIRGGVRTMDGLWRDGAIRYSGGIGYDLGGGAAAIDAGVSWESWSEQSETVLFIGLRASENWL